MGILDDIKRGYSKFAYNIRQRRASARWRRYNKAAQGDVFSIAWPSFRDGVPQWQMYDFETFAAEGFNVNALIYSAIMYKARALATAPLRAYTGDRESPLPADEGHPLAKLVMRPNKWQSGLEFQQQCCVYLNLAGNVFVYIERERGIPIALYALRPDRVYVVPSKTEGLAGYVYVPEGSTFDDAAVILPDDMMHIKLPNPGDKLGGMGYGLSPIASMARNADVDNAVTVLLKNLFDNGLMPNVTINFDAPLNRSTIEEVKRQFKEMYGGSASGWLEPMVLGEGGRVENLGYRFSELGFSEIDERNETRILGPFGVPPILIGSRVGLARATYSNYEQARRAFWQDTFIPELKLFEVEFQYFLNQPQDGVWVAYDLSEVPALKESISDQVSAYTALVGTGVPPIVAAEIAGIPMPVWPGSEVGRVQMSLVPVGRVEQEVGDVSKEPNVYNDTRKSTEPQATKKRQRGLTREAKAALWHKMDTTATSFEKLASDAARRAFERDKMMLVAMINDAKKKAYSRKATVNFERLQVDWNKYFSEQASENWREVFVPIIRAVIERSAQELVTEFGIEFDVSNLFAQQWYQDYVLQFAQDILQTTADDMKKLILQAQQNGWTIDELRKQVEMTFENYITSGYDPRDHHKLTDEELNWFYERMPRYRLENIARTETLKAANAGAFNLYKAWGMVAMKEWLSTDDDRTRHAHKVAGAQYSVGGSIGPIPIDEPFVVGGELMMYPLDGSLGATPQNICQCRCSIAPVIASEE